MKSFVLNLVFGFFVVFGKQTQGSDETVSNDIHNMNETYRIVSNFSEPQFLNGTADNTQDKKRPLHFDEEPTNFTEVHNETSVNQNSTRKFFENEVEMTTSFNFNTIINETNIRSTYQENLNADLMETTSEIISTFLLSSASSCNCSVEETNYCHCTARGGIINSRSGLVGTFIYNIAIKPTEKLMILLRSSEIDFSGSENCSFSIGVDFFYNSSKSLNPERILLFEKSMNITERDTGSCYWKIAYRIGRQYNESSMETGLEGTLKVPPDQDFLQLYRPMTHRLWNIVPGLSNCSIEVAVLSLDLGSTSPTWDGLNGNETGTKADFLAIGSGKLANNESVSLKDTVLYGRSESLLTFIFDECEAHVIFVSDMHYQNASGFNVQYKVIKEDLGENNFLSKTSITPGEDYPIPLMVVNINGITINKTLPVANNAMEFRESIAAMANKFVTRKNFELFGINDSLITEEYIMVNDIFLCPSVYCSEICAAFNFSVNIKRPDGSWLLTTDQLYEMFKVLELKDSWLGKKEVEVCHLEIEFETTWRWIGFGGLVILLILILIISLIFKVSEAIYNESNLRAKGTRERSLNYLSNSSTASSATPNRFSLPSSRRRNNQNNVREPSEWNYNISGFEQFDPVGERVDPRSCGLDEEVVHDRTSVTFYSNSAFDGDEHELFSQAVIGRSQVPTNSNSATDSVQTQNDDYSSDESEIGDFENNRQI